ncbi:MAG: hypothetical protein H6Q74_229 [Firmicutes bacterium]|nr:hypothetical protein [Bacillota bacterium]
MNIEEVEKQLLPYLLKLAESPPVQAELEAAKVAIINVIEAEAAKAVPWGLRTIARFLWWVIKNIKRMCFAMRQKFNLQQFSNDESTTTGAVSIAVQNSAETILVGADVSVTIENVTITAITGDDGNASFNGLAAGTQTFTATLDGYTANSVEITVEAGAAVTGTIVLIATAASAVTTVITAVLSELGDLITDASTEAVEKVIAELEDEIDTTSSLWVKIRDNMEKVFLVTIKSIVISTLVSTLTDKIEEYLEKVLANETQVNHK